MSSGFTFTALDLSLYLFKASRTKTLRQTPTAMAPGVLAPEPTFTVNVMNKSATKKYNFGAVIDDLDLENISGNWYHKFKLSPYRTLTAHIRL